MDFDVICVDHLILLQAILWSIITHAHQTAKFRGEIEGGFILTISNAELLP